MGHIYTTATFTGARGQWSGPCFVDTGATYSILPPSVAEQIEVTFTGWMDHPTIARGERIEAPRGHCTISIVVDGQERTNQIFVWVLEGHEEPIIGAESLEQLGLKVNPTTEKVEIARGWTVRL